MLGQLSVVLVSTSANAISLPIVSLSLKLTYSCIKCGILIPSAEYLKKNFFENTTFLTSDVIILKGSTT